MTQRTLVETFMLPEQHSWKKYRTVRFHMRHELNTLLAKELDGKLSPAEKDDLAEYRNDFDWELDDSNKVKVLDSATALLWMKSRPYDCRW